MPGSTVMVTLDWSRFAETALPVAARLADLLGHGLRIVMVHEPARAPVPAAEVPAFTGPDEVTVRGAQQNYLATIADDLGQAGVRVAEAALIEGSAGPSLVADIERTNPALLVMATHGRGPLSRLWLGSVADHVIRHTSVPVVLVRPAGDPPDPSADATFSAGLVPLDRSPDAEAILVPLVPLARAAGARLTLLHVVRPVFDVADAMSPYPAMVPAPDVLDALQDEARQYLDTVAARVRSQGVDVTTTVVAGLGVAPTILGHLDDGSHDFVAMSTHGAGGFRRMLLGSVADKVIRGAAKPVIILRPESPAG